MTPEHAIEQVADAESFLRFVEALESDRRDIKKEQLSPTSPYSPGRNGWENGTIEGFLEAARAWAQDSKFSSQDWSSASGMWRGFAEFLLAGKFYE
jgi:hypothetical protein